LNADWQVIERTLQGDPAFAAAVRARPGMRVAGCWSGFETAVQVILGGPAALDRDLLKALIFEFGTRVDFAPGLTHLFPTSEALADEDMRRAGLGSRQSLAVRALARAVRDGHIDFEKVLDPKTVMEALAEIPGFTPSALEYIEMRAMREPDAFPPQSNEVGFALGIDDPIQIERRIDAWRPWRAYAAAYLADLDPNAAQARLCRTRLAGIA
jgi:AraC family transcriptional regulator of adaptative response / DNA-3-methyladenine glycosylase II